MPRGLRAMVYSYLPLAVLIELVCRVSKEERQLIRGSELIDQRRPLKIPTSLCDIIHKDDMNYYLDLCTEANFEFLKFESVERDLFMQGVARSPNKIVGFPQTFCIYFGQRNIFEVYQGLNDESAHHLKNVVIKISMNLDRF